MWGVDLAITDADFGKTVKQGLRAKFAGSITRLDQQFKDGAKVFGVVTSHQTMFADKWGREYPSEATAYVKPPPPPAPAKRPRDLAEGYNDDEVFPRQHRKITLPKAFGLAVTRLLLCVVREDALVLGEVNNLFQAGFHFGEGDFSAIVRQSSGIHGQRVG